MDKAKQLAMILTAAKSQGHLDPILDYLERGIDKLGRPIAPQGPEWAFERAFDDGGRKALMDLKTWIEGRTNYSPDGAENTEE